MKIRGKAPHKPRNPLVVLVKQRKAGSHTPDMKQQRQKAKQELHKHLRKKSEQ